jgi:hypothetical protein
MASPYFPWNIMAQENKFSLGVVLGGQNFGVDDFWCSVASAASDTKDSKSYKDNICAMIG